jgi:heat shock protein HslJ
LFLSLNISANFLTFYMKWLIFVLIIGIIIAGGVYIARNSGGGSVPAANEIVRDWTLENYNGQKVGGSISFKTDGKFSANICNIYDGSYAYDSGSLEFSQVAGTLAICNDKNLGEAEAGFVRMSKNGIKTTIADGKLRLQSGGDKLIFY